MYEWLDGFSDVIIRHIDAPYCVWGFSLPDSDGIYNIYINYKVPRDRVKEVIEHELEHIRNGDFYRCDPAHAIEAEMLSRLNY